MFSTVVRASAELRWDKPVLKVLRQLSSAYALLTVENQTKNRPRPSVGVPAFLRQSLQVYNILTPSVPQSGRNALKCGTEDWLSHPAEHCWKLEAELREQILPQVSSWNTVTTCWQYQAVVQDGASVYFQFAFIVEKLNLP